MDPKRESDRIRDSEKAKVLDAAALRRRQKKHLESLERDNFQDDPHANIVSPKKLPKFADDVTPSSASKKRRKRSDHFKLRFRKRIEDLEEEERTTNPNPPNYFSAKAPPSEYPQRRFCSVCGFPSNYTCIRCTSKYCSVNCLKIHEDTRCLNRFAHDYRVVEHNRIRSHISVD